MPPTISASSGFGNFNSSGWSYDDEQYLKALQSEYDIRKQHGIGLDWVEEAIKKNQELKAAGQKGTGSGTYRNDINNAPVNLQGANPGEYSKELQDYIASKSGGFNPYANLTWNFDTRTFTLKQPQSTTPSTSPTIQNPLTPATTPQIKNPLEVLEPWPNTVTPPANKNPAVNTSNLTQAYQNQNQNQRIQLPQQFQQNFNATPSITPPGSPQAIKMPNFNRNAGFSTNWSDLFSVANNRYTR